jgi:hypothetical protein
MIKDSRVYMLDADILFDLSAEPGMLNQISTEESTYLTMSTSLERLETPGEGR